MRLRFQQQLFGRETGILVFRCFSGHIERAPDKGGKDFRVHIGGRHGRRTFADKDPEANFFAFGALDIFEISKTDLHLGGGIADIDSIRSIGAGFFGLGYEGVGAILRFCRF